MFYKVTKNKIKFYNIEVDKKIQKLREEIILKLGSKEHRNIITNDVFNPIEKNSKVINFKYKRRMLFLYEYDYDIIYFPELILLIDSIIESKDYKRVREFNSYQAPLSIRRMEDSRYKKNILKREYPFHTYIKDIKECFKTVLVEEIEYDNEIDLLNKLIEHNVSNKKQLQKVVSVMKSQTEEYQNLIEELSYS